MRLSGHSSPSVPPLVPPAQQEDELREVLARHGASKWDMVQAWSGSRHGEPAREGELLRGVPDSGCGAGLEMLNWVDRASIAEGRARPPVLRRVAGRPCSDHSAPHTWGFWCKKSAPQPGVLAHPRHRMPYHLHDAHFAMVALHLPGSAHQGVVFQASKAEEAHTAELALSANHPQARWLDAQGQELVLTAAEPIAAGHAAVLTLCSQPGHQRLRVDGREVASAAAFFGPSNFAQLLIGWGFRSYFPKEGFGGQVYAVITGKGTPTDAELAVMEAHLARTAGIGLRP